jgi:hypothetical protein
VSDKALIDRQRAGEALLSLSPQEFELDDEFPAELWQLASDCLRTHPKSRPSIAEVATRASAIHARLLEGRFKKGAATRAVLATLATHQDEAKSGRKNRKGRASEGAYSVTPSDVPESDYGLTPLSRSVNVSVHLGPKDLTESACPDDSEDELDDEIGGDPYMVAPHEALDTENPYSLTPGGPDDRQEPDSTSSSSTTRSDSST